MTLTRSVLLLLVAVACFVVALLVAVGAFHSNEPAWIAGGLAAFAGRFLP